MGLKDYKSLSVGVMRRKPGCQKQPAHCDSGFAGAFIKSDPLDVGLAIIIGTTHGRTVIEVYPFDEPSLHGAPTRIELFKGVSPPTTSTSTSTSTSTLLSTFR